MFRQLLNWRDGSEVQVRIPSETSGSLTLTQELKQDVKRLLKQHTDEKKANAELQVEIEGVQLELKAVSGRLSAKSAEGQNIRVQLDQVSESTHKHPVSAPIESNMQVAEYL